MWPHQETGRRQVATNEPVVLTTATGRTLPGGNQARPTAATACWAAACRGYGRNNRAQRLRLFQTCPGPCSGGDRQRTRLTASSAGSSRSDAPRNSPRKAGDRATSIDSTWQRRSKSTARPPRNQWRSLGPGTTFSGIPRTECTWFRLIPILTGPTLSPGTISKVNMSFPARPTIIGLRGIVLGGERRTVMRARGAWLSAGEMRGTCFKELGKAGLYNARRTVLGLGLGAELRDPAKPGHEIRRSRVSLDQIPAKPGHRRSWWRQAGALLHFSRAVRAADVVAAIARAVGEGCIGTAVATPSRASDGWGALADRIREIRWDVVHTGAGRDRNEADSRVGQSGAGRPAVPRLAPGTPTPRRAWWFAHAAGEPSGFDPNEPPSLDVRGVGVVTRQSRTARR